MRSGGSGSGAMPDMHPPPPPPPPPPPAPSQTPSPQHDQGGTGSPSMMMTPIMFDTFNILFICVNRRILRSRHITDGLAVGQAVGKTNYRRPKLAPLVVKMDPQSNPIRKCADLIRSDPEAKNADLSNLIRAHP
ncbi:hypothetical protein PIB30_031969 [Stylosanthes scabra]|uniref:Uncharacterized protein n=1 Tax=Stylosanthes scabra TaxID=79078 RepID=A0ABU6TC84_9FABA|nr:hypothetical protein [Stylosanthes scabra]